MDSIGGVSAFVAFEANLAGIVAFSE
jgi:hypothetical protein